MKHKPALSSAKPITSRRKVAGRAKKGPMALSKVDDKTECMGCPGSSFPSPAIAKKRLPSNVPMNKETASNMFNMTQLTQSKQITQHSTVRALPTPMIHLSSAHKSYTTISALIILTLPKTSFQWDADKYGILFVFQDSSFLSPWTNTCCESRSQGTKSLQNPPLKLVPSTLRWYLYLVPIRKFPLPALRSLEVHSACHRRASQPWCQDWQRPSGQKSLRHLHLESEQWPPIEMWRYHLP